jgi:hypothetical protein
MKTTFITLIAAAWVTLSPMPQAHACHEAVFGPHASFLYGAPSYVSFQAFEIANGSGEDAASESAMTLSAGFTPYRGVPFSVALIQPLSLAQELEKHAEHDHVHREFGVEDTILGLGWRHDFDGLKRGKSGHGNFAAIMLGADLPTGNVDHEPGDGPIDTLLSGIVSLEFDRFSTTLYGHHQWNSFDQLGSKLGDETFAGAGLGWTALPGHGRNAHLSMQLGIGWERTAKRVTESVSVTDSGGWALLAQPTVVWGPNHHWRLFATFGVPIAQEFEKTVNEKSWRGGIGVVWMLGHGGVTQDAGCANGGCASPIACDGDCGGAPTTGGCDSCEDAAPPTAAPGGCDSCEDAAPPTAAPGGCDSCDDGAADKPADCAGCAKPAPPGDCGCDG